MKKVYEKPVLELVSFELNEAIAACGEQVHSNHAHLDCEETPLGAFLEGTLGATFTSDKADCADGNPLEGYCYFTANDSGSAINLFNS